MRHLRTKNIRSLVFRLTQAAIWECTQRFHPGRGCIISYSGA